MNASRQLRAALEEAHQRLEETPFARAALAARVGPQEYVDYLTATEVVVASLCTEVARSGTPEERRLFEPLSDWMTRLHADLDDLAAASRSTNPGAIRPALRLAHAIRRLVGRDDPRLLGIAYVLFGSHRGNRGLAGPFSVALSRNDGSGTRYVRATADDPSADRLSQVLQRVDALDADSLGETVDAGLETFQTFQAILEALVPGAPRTHHVATLNPEAGDHPIPRDSSLLALAADVADRVMDSFSYLGLRFGERGGRFARSDGAWMLSLGRLPERAAERQIDWLSGVLSNRGIPSLCLEAHLRELHGELAALPTSPSREGDQTATVARLEALEQRVRARRLTVVSSERFEELSSVEVPALGARAGEILLGAVVDQAADVGRCAENLQSWAAGEPRLDEQSRSQIHDTLGSFSRALA